MHQTFYRKYRPKKFANVYGQDLIVKTLTKSIKNNTISHAYLFSGPRGTGKTSSAKLLAKALNCLNAVDGDACDECENCRMFNENSNPDIIEIDAASNNGVDEIREIRNNVNLVPSVSKYKIYIIDEVHMLSIGAFNALLKTLEEPPEYVIFILATTEPFKLPNTVISRCQRYDFKLMSEDALKKGLGNIIKKENIKIDDNALEEIIYCSAGGMRDAVGLLEQLSMYSDDVITLNDVDDVTGSISQNELQELINYVEKSEYNIISEKINKYNISGKDLYLIFQKITDMFFDALISKKTHRESLNCINIEESKLYEIIDILNNDLKSMKDSYQKKIVMEVSLFKICDLLKQKSTVEQINVSRETYNDNFEQKKYDYDDITNIRINNILLKATKEKLLEIKSKMLKITDYMNDDEYKVIVGINQNSIVAAASDEGAIITLPTSVLLEKLRKKEYLNNDFFKTKIDLNIKLVYITEEYWKKIRPEYVSKLKNNNLKYIDEKTIITNNESKKDENSISEFNELIEMEG